MKKFRSVLAGGMTVALSLWVVSGLTANAQTTTTETALASSSTTTVPSSPPTSAPAPTTTRTASTSPAGLGPVLRWKLDEPATASVAADEVGSFPGTYSPDAVRGISGAPGLSGTAAKGAVQGDFPPALAGKPVSLEFWSKAGINRTSGFIGRIGSVGVYRYEYNVNYRVRLYSDSAIAETDMFQTEGIDVDADRWHHYVVTQDGATARLYVDAVPVLKLDMPWSASDGKVLVGEQPGRSTDDVAVYPGVLSQAEISSHFSLGAGGRECLGASPSTPYSQRVAADGAVSAWGLGDSGRVAYDRIGCHNGAFRDGAIGAPGFVDGTQSDGGTKYTYDLDAPAMSLIVEAPVASGGPVSLEFWSRRGNYRSAGSIAGIGNIHLYRQSWNGNESIRLYVNGEFVERPLGYFDGAIDVNGDTWHHYVLEHDGTTASLLIDGVVLLSKVAPFSRDSGRAWIGGQPGREYDEAALYPKALSLTDASVHFTLGNGGSPCVVATSSPYTQRVTVDGVSNLWRLDDAGRVAYDLVGCRNGAYRAAEPANGVTGNAGGAHKEINALDAPIVVVSAPEAIVGNSPVSLEFWSKGGIDRAAGWMGRVGDLGVYRYTYNGNYSVRLATGGLIEERDLGYFDGIYVDADRWHHYVVTHDGTTARLFIDGTQRLAKVASWTRNDGVVSIGGQPGRTMADVGLYPKVLTPGEISAHFSLGLTGGTCDRSGAASGYVQRLVADGATSVWRLGDSDQVAVDPVGCRPGSYGDGRVQAPGALAGDPNGATLGTHGYDAPVMVAPLAGVTSGGSPVSFELWSKGGTYRTGGFIGRLGSLAVYRYFNNGNTAVTLLSGGLRVDEEFYLDGANIDADIWHHFAVTHDGTTARLYIDGVLRFSLPSTWTLDDSVMAVGGQPGRTYDELALFPKTLSATEVLSHFLIGKKSATVTTLTGPSGTWPQNAPVTFTSNVTGSGGTSVAGTVELLDGESVIATKALDTSGTAAFSVSLASGAHLISARFVETATHIGSRSAALTQSASGGMQTTLTVVSSPNPSVIGESVTVTATVVRPTGVTDVATGFVSFARAGAAPLVAPLTEAGRASVTVTGLDLGTSTFAVTYGGDTLFAGSSGAVSHTVRKGESVTDVVLSTATVRAGEPVNLEVRVTKKAPATGFATGTVTVKNGTDIVGTGTLDAAGNTTIAVPTTTIGQLSLTAQYSGDITTDGSISSGSTVTVRSATDPVTMTPAVTRIAVGETLPVSIKVARIGTRPMPTGTVTIMVDNVTSTTVTLDASGEASTTLSGLTVGPHVLKAVHAGDSNYAASTSADVSVTVLPPLAVTITGPEQGSAPLAATYAASVVGAATAATIEWVFGDDTPAQTGASVNHQFVNPGVYTVRATATVDGLVTTATKVVQVSAKPLTAVLGVSEIRTVETVNVTFDGSPSTGPVGSLAWDFGDGTTGTGYTPNHTYTTAGQYTVTLTVADKADPSKKVQVLGLVIVAAQTDARLTVKQASNNVAVGGVDLFLKSTTKPNREYRGVTSSDGRAVLPALDNDTYDVYAYKDGFLPKRVALTLPPAATDADKVVLLDVGQVADAQVAPPVLLTPAQIASAGIDTTKVENRQVITYQLQLSTAVGGSPIAVPLCVNASSVPVACPPQANAAAPVGPVTTGTGSSGTPVSSQTFAGGGQIIYTTVSADTITYMTMPLEGSFVKDFFQARMVISNRATQTGFVLHDGVAQVAVPSNMTVMPNRYPMSSNCVAGRVDPSPTAPQPGWPARVTVGDIPAGGCAEVDWILRGDTTCSCFISAAYDGVLAPFERTVRTVAKSASPFVVYGAEALQIETDVIVSDGMTPVAGQPNTYDVAGGTTVEYVVNARNITTDRTLTGLEITYPVAGGVTALGPFLSNAQTVDQPIRTTIASLGPLQTVEAGRLRLYASKDARVVFPAATTVIRSLPVPGVVNAPVLKSPRYLMAYDGSTRTISWDPVPGATSYELYASTTNLLPAAPVATITAVAGVAPKWVIPAGSPLDAFIVADIATRTSAAPGDYIHRPLVRPDGTSDCFGALTTAPFVCAGVVGGGGQTGVLTAVITRQPNDSTGNRLYKIELKVTGLKPGTKTRFNVTQPATLTVTPTGALTGTYTADSAGTVTLTVTAINPRGVFQAQATDTTSKPLSNDVTVK